MFYDIIAYLQIAVNMVKLIYKVNVKLQFIAEIAGGTSCSQTPIRRSPPAPPPWLGYARLKF